MTIRRNVIPLLPSRTSINTGVKAVFLKFFNVLCGMHSGYHGYVLLEPRKAVKGLFVAVPQIEHS